NRGRRNGPTNVTERIDEVPVEKRLTVIEQIDALDPRARFGHDALQHVNRQHSGSRRRNAAAQERRTAASELRRRARREQRNRATDAICRVLLRSPKPIPYKKSRAAVAVRIA